MGVPVRLIKRDGSTLALDAVGFSMGVRRGVAAIPVPVFGERFGTDMNLVSVDIRIEAILRDDDCSGAAVAPTKASCFVDFGRKATVNTQTETAEALPYMGGDGGPMTVAQLNNKSFSLRSTYQDTSTSDSITVVFDSTTASHTSTAALITNVGIQGMTTGQQIAAAVATALTAANYTPTVIATGGGTQFTDSFTIAVTAGQLTTLPGGNNTKVTITQKVAGLDGNTETPVFWTDSTGTSVTKPTFQEFLNGEDHSCKSAGDKMQDLIANVANSNVMGAIGSVFNLSGETADGGFGLDIQMGDEVGNDYIIGLQLPYNSLQQVGTAVLAASDPPNYATRNFLVVTGLSNPLDQNSEGNVQDASVKFDTSDLKTGIRGTVTDVSFKYSAGETVYSADITFQPLDMIVGL